MKCESATPAAATPAEAEMAEEPTNRGPEGGRKSSKPLMEKRRRARINDCLTELQRILDTLNPEGSSSRQNKREKADILEQTVKLVKQLRQQGSRGNPPDPQTQVQFRAGFNDCMATVAQFLSTNHTAFNGDAKAGLMSHLANSIQCNKPYADRLPHTRRRADEPTNSGSASIRPSIVQPTSSQSEHGTGSMNVVHPMPAPPSAAVMSPPAPSHAHSSVAVAASSNSPPQQAAAVPSVTARLELTSHGANGGQATRLVPISIPIKVQSPGQFILVPSQMLSGGQLAAAPLIPVMNSPPASVAPGPSSSGSSGSVAMSPVIDHQRSPPKQSPQPVQIAAQPAAGPSAMVYAPYPAAALGLPAGAAFGVPAGAANSPQAAARYPVAFVAIGEPRPEGANGAQVEPNLVYPNFPGFYAMPANPQGDAEDVWRPW